ncbi:PorT family protein [Fulvivirga sp. RKSG066]|uniref:outer membrane beta-barrel protein n=1 Tax=Fulvivirga aurantia TaxID=2529383 RepID=UPI0012BB94FF|nr:outer membrane beta-barrel protein [Fulvivirga aurantia]MTI20062.1 PorT family protein [Fulvivirga aurantia]
MLLRKILLLVTLALLVTPAFSQFTIGLKFSPTLSTNRVEAKSDTASIGTNGNGLRLAIGPIADIQIRENYFLSTGLLFVSKRAGVEATGMPNRADIEEEYGLQYLQVPVTMKLFTNEVALDKKIYFQVGATLDFNINEEPKKQEYFLVEDFFIFDSSLLIGMGMEYKVGVNTVVFGGFTYQRGLVNQINDHAPLDGDINLKNDYISLDLGVKF